MANILVFEGTFWPAEAIYEMIIDSPHEQIGHAKNLQEVEQYISRIALGALDVDVLLLGDNLSKGNAYRALRFQPNRISSQSPLKKLFRNKNSPVVHVEPDGYPIHEDARMIRTFMKACGVTVPTIGISEQSMSQNGVDVDYDFGELHGKLISLEQQELLLDAIDAVTH